MKWNKAAAEESGANVLYTEYIAGTTVPNPHWSWRPSFANDAIRDWLFLQQQETPYNKHRRESPRF